MKHPDPRHRRPHSRRGRTAQTRELQRIRAGHRRYVAMLSALAEPHPGPVRVRDLMTWYRIRHRRWRTSARRAEQWRLMMMERQICAILHSVPDAWGTP